MKGGFDDEQLLYITEVNASHAAVIFWSEFMAYLFLQTILRLKIGWYFIYKTITFQKQR